MEETLKKIETVLETQVRPSLRAHGGEIAIDHLEDGILYVKLLGQCAGCPSADLTNETIVEAEVVKALHRMDSARQLYQRIAAACAGLLLLTGGYLLWKTGTGPDSVTSLPVYGNYALPEPCWRYWEEDTVSAGRQEVLDEAFPLPVQRQSAMYTRYKDLTLRQ